MFDEDYVVEAFCDTLLCIYRKTSRRREKLVRGRWRTTRKYLGYLFYYFFYIPRFSRTSSTSGARRCDSSSLFVVVYASPDCIESSCESGTRLYDRVQPGSRFAYNPDIYIVDKNILHSPGARSSSRDRYWGCSESRFCNSSATFRVCLRNLFVLGFFSAL